jgi:hypothetical protein
MVLAVSAFYFRFGGFAWMQGAFYGIGAAVIASRGQRRGAAVAEHGRA